MINPKQHLSNNIFKKNIEKLSTRVGFGEGLVTAGEQNNDVVCLSADLSDSTKANLFKEKFPNRYFEVGVAEQALVTVASGLANYVKIPFVTSYAAFSPGRNYEQIRTTIAINDVPVKIVGSHAGLATGEDGATHQMLEDISMMRSLPNMIVLSPCDAIEAEKAVIASVTNNKPTYIRLARNDTPVFTTQSSPFEIGKANDVWVSKDPQVALVATGPLVYEALLAAKELSTRIACLVMNVHTIKPLDELTLIRAAKTCGSLVTIEDHQVNGGLGSAVAEVLAKNFPTPLEMIGVKDMFGESGKPEELYEKHEMTKIDIIKSVKKVIARRLNN